MSNLLEKASILTTPTAYDDGKILSVKPSIVLGNELITNGDFSNGSTGWTVSNGTITDKYNASMTAYQTGIRILPFSNTGTFKVTFDLVVTSGSCKFDAGGVNNAIFNTSGTKEIIVTNTTKFEFNAFNLGWVGTLDNVSVKEEIDGDFDFTRNSSATRVNEQGLVEDVQILSSNLVQNGDFSQEGSELVTNGSFDTDSDWTKQTSWSIGGGAANYDFLSDAKYIRQTLLSGGFVAGKSYKISFEITSGTAYMNVSSNGGGLISLNTYSVGSYSIYVTASASGSDLLIYGRNTSGTAFSIDNVSVKEVGQDWDILNDVNSFSFDNGIANIQGTANSANNGIKQASIPAVIGKTYKISATLRSNDGGLYRFRLLDGSYFDLGNGNSSEFETITSYHTATNTAFTIFATSWYTSGTANFDISNISVIEITDDTNLPRIDYTDGVGSWLFEPQSTNLVTYSSDFSIWTKDNVTVQGDSHTSPDGNIKATLIKGNTNSSKHNIRKTLTGSVDGSYSVFAKAKELRYLQIASINTTNQYINFDLQDGLIGTVGSNFSNAKIEEFSDGWYRLSVTSDDRYNSFYISLVSGINSGWLETWAMSNNTDGLYIWGAQLEQSSFATSYIPTEGSIKTRLQDAAFGAGSSDLINSTEGVLYAEIAALADDLTNKQISLNNGTTDDRIQLYYSSSSNQISVFYKSQSGATAFILNHTLSDITQFNKVAFKWKQNDFALWSNGVEVATQTSGVTSTANTLTKLDFTQFNGSADFFGKTKCVAVFKEALTDEELTCLTTI